MVYKRESKEESDDVVLVVPPPNKPESNELNEELLLELEFVVFNAESAFDIASLLYALALELPFKAVLIALRALLYVLPANPLSISTRAYL